MDCNAAKVGEARGSVDLYPRAWDQLTEEEKRALAPKLISVENPFHLTGPELGAAAGAFNEIVSRPEHPEADGAGAEPDAEQVSERVCAVRNFIELSGGQCNSGIWQSLERIIAVWEVGGMVELVIRDRRQFKTALTSLGYAVNKWWDRLPFISVHPNDTARQLTDTSLEPALHFANDDPSRITTYWAHVDARSMYFRNSTYASRVREILDAAGSHRRPSKPSRIRALIF